MLLVELGCLRLQLCLHGDDDLLLLGLVLPPLGFMPFVSTVHLLRNKLVVLEVRLVDLLVLQLHILNLFLGLE